jgi:hypothetical protein
MKTGFVYVLALLGWLGTGEATAQSVPNSPGWQYTLLPASRLTDDCYCGRPTITVPMTGTFQLIFRNEDPLFAYYTLTNIDFTAPFGDRTYKVAGHGAYVVGGEVGLVQTLILELQIDDGFTNKLCYLNNDSSRVERLWPILAAHLDQTNGQIIQFYRLDLAAAPMRELWFSTVHGFTPGTLPPYTDHVSSGDLVASNGRVVKRNQDLSARLGIMPMVPDLGLKDVDLLPGGEIAFSIETIIWSESLGPLLPGDLLSDAGRVVFHTQDLLAASDPATPAAEAGLDAVQARGGGEVWFSIQTNFFSKTLGRTIRRGDLLSNRGSLVRTNEQLLARFHPASPKQDYGLDALYVWPSGEMWFSTEDGFDDTELGAITSGDLLSDQGYVAYRNHELLSAFRPLEELADFGLDALHVVTDAGEAPPPARFTRCAVDQKTGGVTFEWSALGRAFQLERATNATGPWLPFAPIGTGTNLDVLEPGNPARAFYRLREW